MFDTRKVLTHGWLLALYAAIVVAIVGGFVAQMMNGDCPV